VAPLREIAYLSFNCGLPFYIYIEIPHANLSHSKCQYEGSIANVQHPSPYNPPPGLTLFGQQYSPPQSGPSPLGPPSHPLPGSGGLDQFGEDDTTQLYPNPSDECGFDIECFLALEFV